MERSNRSAKSILLLESPKNVATIAAARSAEMFFKLYLSKNFTVKTAMVALRERRTPNRESLRLTQAMTIV